MSWQSSNTPSIGEVEDVGVGQREHLRRLERAHAPVRRQHEDATPRLPRIAYSADAAGVARRRAEDVQRRRSRASTCSNRLPSSCSAMSLNASVGRSTGAAGAGPARASVSGVISALPNVSRV